MNNKHTDKMEEDNFINILVKNLQMLCHDHLPFEQSLEVTGHVCIHIDAGLNLNLFLNEKCNKVNTSSVFTSLSFQAPSSLPTDTDLTEGPEKQSVKSSAVVKKNAIKRLFINRNVETSNLKSLNVKKVGKPNYSKLSQLESSIVRPSKKMKKSCADNHDDGETAVAIVQEKPFIRHLSSKVIVKHEHHIPTATEIIKKSTEIERYDHKGEAVKDEILIEGDDEEESLQDDENDMEHVERMQIEGSMVDEDEEIPVRVPNDDDNEDDDKTTDHDYGENSVTHTEDDLEIPDLSEVNNYFDPKELDDGIEYTIVDMATKKGRPMLIDSVGFGYNIRRNTDKTVHWTCSVRNKQTCCAAGVLQCNDSFKRNKHEHCHPPKPGLLTSTIIVAEARAQANNDPVTPTSLVVQRAMTVKGKSEDETFLPRTSNLKRMINRYRQCKREGGLPKKKNQIDFVKFEALDSESQ